MRVEVTLPDMGEDTVEAVTVAGWLAQDGTDLQDGDDLLELTTDKAAFVLPAPRAGRLVERRVSTGDTVRVGEVVCIFEV